MSPVLAFVLSRDHVVLLMGHVVVVVWLIGVRNYPSVSFLHLLKLEAMPSLNQFVIGSCHCYAKPLSSKDYRVFFLKFLLFPFSIFFPPARSC